MVNLSGKQLTFGSLFRAPTPVYQDLSTCQIGLLWICWSVWEGISKDCWQLIPWVLLGAWNNYLGAASQKLLTKIKISLSKGLCFIQKKYLYGLYLHNITCVENLAFGKRTEQRRTCCGGWSWKAVDGNLGTDFSVNRQCAHTQEDNPSWWWVDLGSDKVPVSEVLLVNRFSPREDIRQRNEDFVLTLGQ